MPFHPEDAYNDLPLLPPERELESKAVLKQCIAANRALAELKGAGDLIPNPTMLINAIPLQEAKLSSEIENIVTTQDKLYKAALDESRQVDPSTKEVLRYRTALRRASERIKEGERITISLMENICATIHDDDIGVRDRETVYIADRVAGSVIYTPPCGRALLMEELENLIDFIDAGTDLDPLVRMAVAHYQFEAIHPFTDGNGRTGRILNIVHLLQEKLLNLPVLYLSRFIIGNKGEYYRRLREVTESHDWEGYLLYMLRGVESTALLTTERIHAVRELLEETLEKCRHALPGNVYSKELIELIFVQPYCRINFLVDSGLAERKTASRYLRELQELGILESQKVGREVIYSHPALLRVLSS